MRIGIGIDTGGTCTDIVAYDLDAKKILASGKTPTTHEDLAVGISNALDQLDPELLHEARAVALSTTLATNACVEDKTGQGSLILLSAHEASFRDLGGKYGIGSSDTLVFVDSETAYSGQIVREPDWSEVEKIVKTQLSGSGAVGVVEMYSQRTGSVLEQRVREIASDSGIATVCGHELFSEPNIVVRAAGTLLNAKLTSIITGFLDAVRRSMASHDMAAEAIVVRSDSSLMVEEVARRRPVDTLLCGPAASVMGALELCGAKSGIVIDMGGTTTDIAQVKDGFPRRMEDRTRIGRWETFVKSIHVDTFGLGGDSEVLVDRNGDVSLGTRRAMPMCMAASRFPKLLNVLERIADERHGAHSWRNDVYVSERDISDLNGFTDLEKQVASALYKSPMALRDLETDYGLLVTPQQLEHLQANSALIRCGVTPTDAMHVRGDFGAYDARASKLAFEAMSHYTHKSAARLCEEIYTQAKKTLYFDVVRSLMAAEHEGMEATELSDDMLEMIEAQYQLALGRIRGDASPDERFLNLGYTCSVPLVGIGGPIGLFLGDVAKMLGTTAFVSEHAGVANALGAIAGNVSATVSYEIAPDTATGEFLILGNGETHRALDLESARGIARHRALESAEKEALERGAVPGEIESFSDCKVREVTVGSGDKVFLGATVTATAYGTMSVLAASSAADNRKAG